MASYFNFQIRQKQEHPLDDKDKYSVTQGHIVVNPNKLLKSNKVQKQLQALRKHHSRSRGFLPL